MLYVALKRSVAVNRQSDFVQWAEGGVGGFGRFWCRRVAGTRKGKVNFQSTPSLGNLNAGFSTRLRGSSTLVAWYLQETVSMLCYTSAQDTRHKTQDTKYMTQDGMTPEKRYTKN